MKSVTVGGMPLSVVDQGTGPPLLFIHGFPLSQAMWQAQIEAFAGTHRVLAPDLRGFGKSGISDGAVTMEQFADDLDGMLTALGVTQPVVYCGLSMGGYIAWQFVRKYRERVAALVLCDTRAGADTPAAAQNRLDLARKVLADGPAVLVEAMLPKLFAAISFESRPQLIEQVRQVILDANAVGLAGALRGMAERPDMAGMVATIDRPTLVVVGAEDAVTPPQEMQQLAALIPEARYAEIPAAGHLAPLENPEQVNQEIRRFLGR